MRENLDAIIARADRSSPMEVTLQGQRFAVISDVHANLEALQAVLAHIQGQGITEIVHLGDLVGYGPDPKACIALARDFTANIAGNHDVGIYAKAVSRVSPLAELSWNWTRRKLDSPEKTYLHDLPFKLRIHYNGRIFEAYHASPVPGEIFTDYLYPLRGKDPTLFDAINSETCFVGHTHIPLVIIPTGVMQPQSGTTLNLTLPGKKIVNPGSVGQPRDGNPHASYLVVDGDTIAYHRVAYDVSETQRKIHKAGIATIADSTYWTEILANRLALGR